MQALRKFSLPLCRTHHLAGFYHPVLASPCIASSLSSVYRFASTAAHQQQQQHKGPNYYKRLEVSTDATPQEIKAAYRRLALQCHPDVVEDTQKAIAEAQFRAVSEAYEVLSDPRQRREHDDRLGVKTARKQEKKATSAPDSDDGAKAETQKTSYSSMYGTSNYRNRGADATSEEEVHQQQRQAARMRMASARRKRNYVRKDADRAFADAFDGKTLDQVIFEARRRKRLEAAQKATQAAVSDHKGGSGGVKEKPAGREETMRRVMEHASEAFAEQAARQYGPGILKHVRVYQRHPFRQAAALPGGHMPFRPFLNWEVPEGVTTPTLKEKEPSCHVSEIAAKNGNPTYVPFNERESEWARQMAVPQFTLDDGTLMPRNYSLTRLQRNVRGMANNMGQLYSYHRPY